MIDNTITNIDCREGLKTIPDNSIDMCLTDPPYFLKDLGDDWDTSGIPDKKSKQLIKNLPIGMAFDPEQGIKFERFFSGISCEIVRVLKPGGFFLSFSSPRLYHRMVMAIETVGFEIRDMIMWRHSGGQSKAFSLCHFIKKNKHLTNTEISKKVEEMRYWKTPQMTPLFEPICLAQKPKEGTFLENWEKWGVGLMNTHLYTPSTIIECPKPNKKEKGDYNSHISVKPIFLCEKLIECFTQHNSLILDPFMGSGTTAIASIKVGRRFVGFERDASYINICNKRIIDIQYNSDFFNQ